MIYLKLFYIFFKTGLFTIGGGLATLPLLHEQTVGAGLISNQDFYDMLAVSQSTPGPIGINLATYVGYELGSIPGAIIATLAMVAPSIITIYVIAKFISDFNKNAYVRRAMRGFRPTAVGMIATAAYFVLVNSVIPGGKNSEPQEGASQIVIGGIFLLSAYLYYKYKPHPVFIIIGSAIAGIIFLG